MSEALLSPRRVVLAGSVLCLTALAPAPVQTTTPPPEPTLQLQAAEVAATVAAWQAMWNSYDLAVVDELFLDSPRLTYFSSERGGRISGLEALKEHHAGFGFVVGGTATGNRLWLEEVETAIYGAAAVVTARWMFEGAGVGEPPGSGPVTFVLVAIAGGGARIAHAHFANEPAASED